MNSLSRSLAAWISHALSIMWRCTFVGSSAKSSGHQLLSRYSLSARSKESSSGQASLGGMTFSPGRVGCQGLGLTNAVDPGEPVSDAHRQLVQLGALKYPAVYPASSSARRAIRNVCSPATGGGRAIRARFLFSSPVCGLDARSQCPVRTNGKSQCARFLSDGNEIPTSPQQAGNRPVGPFDAFCASRASRNRIDDFREA